MKKIICLSKNYIIRNLHSLITKCENTHQVETLISLIDFVAHTKARVPMRTIDGLMREDKNNEKNK